MLRYGHHESITEGLHPLGRKPDPFPAHEIPHGGQEGEVAVGFPGPDASEDAAQSRVLDFPVQVI